MLIRPLDPVNDLDAVIDFYHHTADYWLMVGGRLPGAQKASDFFTDGPPGCDPLASARLGLFLKDELSGLAELSFGFPEVDAAYLGLMLLGTTARGLGHGTAFSSHVEDLARRAGAPRLYLAVLQANPRGRAFWTREGYVSAGLSRVDNSNGLEHVIIRLVKLL
ncbi:MAG: GNAT family N-acetyltransferase [Rhodobacteraceae bacterium]|nr:MAG: GNAT family N-acetyltransferase [Paracoccaceae bacterium]PCJ08947.1 MAG: GNAT family N-acetyltransferase [Paracoccaceae bacterium]